uniref:Uncharacterized protein n=1 Tax=Anguilla anguilla TaxID=7936 RepID=A0A0E9UCN2_ANGAN
MCHLQISAVEAISDSRY